MLRVNSFNLEISNIKYPNLLIHVMPRVNGIFKSVMPCLWNFVTFQALLNARHWDQGEIQYRL